MGLKLWTFSMVMTRWMAVVALALLPTAILIVAYRWCRGRPLWSLADIPLVVEVTTCVAWLAMLMAAHMMLVEYLGAYASSDALAVAASLLCAMPVAFAYVEIERLERAFGKYRSKAGNQLPA